MITEYQQLPGQWELSLLPDTPLSVRESIPLPLFGQVDEQAFLVVTMNRLAPGQALTRSLLLSQAIYSGIIRRRSNQMRTFGGASIVVLLGNESGAGQSPLPPTSGGGPSITWQTTQTAVLAYFQGITYGSFYSTNAKSVDASWTPKEYTWRGVYGPFADQVGVEWRVRPDGVMDSAGLGVGQRASGTGIFNNTPTVCLLRDTGSRDGTIIGLQTTTLEVSEDTDSFLTAVVEETSDFVHSGTTTPGYPYADFDSGLLDTTRTIIGAVDTTSNTDLANAANGEYVKYSSGHREIRVAVNEYAIPRLLIPGDSVYIYDPLTGLTGSSQVTFRGRVLPATTLRLTGYQWPVQQGMGVYVIYTVYGTGQYVVDISDWVQWETGDTTLYVDRVQRPLAPVMQTGPSFS